MDQRNLSAPMNLSSPEETWEAVNSSMVEVVQSIHFPRGTTLFAAVSCVAIIVVGCFGNLITILALGRTSKLRNATTAFVISLCTADLLFCSINLPLTASRYIHEDWILGDTLCQLFPFFFYGNVAASLMSMVAITINRFVLINCFSAYDKIYRKRYVALMILLYWAFSFGIMTPPLIKAWGQLGYHSETFSCTILALEGKSPKKFLFVLGFLLPCLVISVSYSCIFYKVRRSSTAQNSHRGTFTKDELHLTRLMLTIFFAFLLCFLPLMIVNVFDGSITYPTLHVLASVLAWMSSAINPFVYAIMNRQYRQAYVLLLCPGRKTLRTDSSGCSKTQVSDVYVYNALTNKMEQRQKLDGNRPEDDT